MSSAPDLQKGIPLWQKILGGSIGTAVALAGALTFYSAGDHQEQVHRNIIKQAGMPEGFFYADNSVPSKSHSAKKFVYEKPKHKKKTIRAVPHPPHRRPLSAAEVFVSAKVDMRAQHMARLRQELNNRRRATALTQVAYTGNTYKNSKKSSALKNWDKYGVKKDVASYPVRLDRTITVDRMIPALLINEIISDLSGKVTAQIEENIYGAHGRKILIPAGSKAIGRYVPLKKVGDERLILRWERIITPDGININTTRAELADAMGRSGGTGEVDHRYTERYGMALLFSTITAGVAWQVPVSSTNQQIVVSNYTQGLANATDRILQNNINIKPRIRIPAGTRIFINPVRDIWFPPPKGKEINVVPSKINRGSNQ